MYMFYKKNYIIKCVYCNIYTIIHYKLLFFVKKIYLIINELIKHIIFLHHNCFRNTFFFIEIYRYNNQITYIFAMFLNFSVITTTIDLSYSKIFLKHKDREHCVLCNIKQHI
ncbi:hypothetical protein EDEG_02148 [Edhazardia aedis USNM 41457]|uniref:Uncharacterized protein n=1 Tax=Edhazardia aedis (strain USNM 41457) TaxID=1003232 RepID=J9DQB3_EDHAE|nr:hypothetical protein EDEG_02148 [Edhazardia aedis USNM 41457]|eukprot:EJW03527.1 hypothetical protein EDEG_02148 [Edhazardia aedis USNM 41457]